MNITLNRKIAFKITNINDFNFIKEKILFEFDFYFKFKKPKISNNSYWIYYNIDNIGFDFLIKDPKKIIQNLII